ncbi:hypothetical protein Avbf_07834 [Armadillidium vulgare]|nr:hypothetical protein Avbf_07834 [Armadillidium vulgare]
MRLRHLYYDIEKILGGKRIIISFISFSIIVALIVSYCVKIIFDIVSELKLGDDGANFLKSRQQMKMSELDEQLAEYIAEWRKQRAKEEDELKKLKDKQAKRKVLRAEEEKKLEQQKKSEEERKLREEAERKQKEQEEKRRRLEEAEKKRQTMMKGSSKYKLVTVIIKN